MRDDCTITFVIPLPSPVPPSPETSAALTEEFASRDIDLVTGNRIASLDGDRNVAVLDDGRELPYDLFLGVPKHRAPEVVIDSGMTEDGYIPVDTATLETTLSRAFTRSVTSPPPGFPRPACSPKVRRRWSPGP